MSNGSSRSFPERLRCAVSNSFCCAAAGFVQVDIWKKLPGHPNIVQQLSGRQALSLSNTALQLLPV